MKNTSLLYVQKRHSRDAGSSGEAEQNNEVKSSIFNNACVQAFAVTQNRAPDLSL